MSDPLTPSPTESDLDAARAAGTSLRVYADGWGDVVEGLAEVGAGGRRSHSGVEVIGGQVQVEANRDLFPREWRGSSNEPGVVDAMMLDPVGAAIASEYRDNLRPARPRIEPAADATPEEEADAEYVETVLFKTMPAGGWRCFWDEAIEGVVRGLSLFERTFPFDKALGANVVRLDPILPWSIENWIPDSNGWSVEQAPTDSDEQRASRNRRGVVLDSKRLVAVRYGWQNRGGNPEPYGLMRPGYRSWKSRRLLHLLLMNGSERAAYGIPYIEIDPDVAQKGDLDTVKNMMRNWRASLRGFGTFPPGYKPGVLTVPFDAAKVTALYDRMGIEWFQACGVAHLRIGDGAGAFNLHESMGSAFGRRLQGVSLMLAEFVEREIVRPLVLLRRPGADRFPKVNPGETLVGSPIELIGSSVAAVAAGVVVDRDGEVEERIRSLLLLPDAPASDDDETVDGGAGGPDVQKAAFNGAQIASAVGIVERVIAGSISRESGVAMLVGFFPIDTETAEAMLGDTAFEAPTAAPPSFEPEVDEDAEPDADDVEDGDPESDPSEESEDVAEAVETAEALSLADRFDGRLDAFGRLTSGPGGRPPRDEERVIRLDETRAKTERGARAAMDAIDDWRGDIATEYAGALATRSTPEEMLDVDVPGVEELTAALVAVYGKAYASGVSSISSEKRRADAGPPRPPSTPSDATPHDFGECHCGTVHAAEAPLPAPGLPSDRIDTLDPDAVIRSIAATTAHAEAAKVKTATLAALQARGRTGFVPDGEDFVDVVKDTVRQLSLPLARVAGQKDVNTVFGIARQQALRAQGSRSFMYSNFVESETCTPCADRDGDTFGPTGLAEYATPAVWCEGGDLCNCLILALD